MNKYSVLMSIYIKENPVYFKKAVDSMLYQTLKPSEIVLVCDGPLTQELDTVIGQYMIDHSDLFQVVRFEKNRGLGIALSEGIQYCHHEIVARMDTDDIAVGNRMEIQMRFLESHPEISCVGGQIQEFIDVEDHLGGIREVPCAPEDIRKRIAFRNPMNHMTVTFRKSDVLNSGNYQNMIGYEDYDLWARMISKGFVLANVSDILCHVRVGSQMYGRRGGLSYFKNAREMLKRLRNLGLTNTSQYWKSLTLRFISCVLLPNELRGFLFQKLMRKKTKEE